MPKGVAFKAYVFIFASHYNFPGVQAVINFAGGRGAKGNNIVCSEQNLLDTFAFAGKTSRVPTLWIYNQNDKAFSAQLANQMLNAFVSFGWLAHFIMLPPFGNDGHSLFSSPSGISIWQPLTKEFLKKISLCPLCK